MEVEEQTMANQYQQQEIYAKQAALSIENFFNNFKHSLEFISKRNEIIFLNDESKIFMKNYFETHIDELSAITRISDEGKILYTYPYMESAVGKDVSHQPHNAAIIRTNNPIISDVFMTIQGYRAIVYAFPVFKNKNYEGCISLVIPFDYIANKYLKGIKLGKRGTSIVISEAGIELYCDQEEHVGQSIFERVNGSKKLNNMIHQMLSMEEGGTEYEYKNLADSDVVKKIAVFKPVHLGNTFWSIAIISSKSEVLEANRGFIINFLVLLVLIVFLIIIFAYFIVRQQKKSRDLIRRKDKKYKDDLEKLVLLRTDELTELNASLQSDVIKRRKIENELKSALETVEKSEKIKSEFLAQMSHEIRTPINTILSFSALLKEELSAYSSEELNYGFKGIQSAGKRLIRTIDLILNMSDVQLGTYKFTPKTIDVFKDVIINLLMENRVQINEKKLNVSHILKTENSKITGDSYTVNQILANLFENAIKYTDEGSVTIECDRDGNGNLLVSIIDTGVGISKDYLPKLFDEFSQEDQGYTRKFEGNGLGLALVKKYCELNNALISVESEKGKGSKFTVTFLND